MEEDTVELIDYLRVIWKRKALIIIVTLAFMVIAGTISFMVSDIYRAEALISIGKRLDSPSPSPSPFLAPLDTPENLAKSIPIEYSPHDEETPQYTLESGVMRGTSFIKITQEGPDRRKTKELLEGVVKKLTNNHIKRTEASLQPYKALVEKLIIDIEMIQGEIISVEKKIENVNPENDDLTLAILAQNYLLQKKAELRNIQQNLILYQSLLTSHEYRTRVIGGVQAKKTPVKPKKKLNIFFAGISGLMASTFLAFILEYFKKANDNKRGTD